MNSKKMIVLGLAGGGAAAPVEPDPVYLLNDTFLNALAAGSVNGTAATPTGSNRVVVDTGSKLTINASGQLVFSTRPAWEDPGIWWGQQTRAAGKIFLWSIEGMSTVAGNGIIAGWATAQTGLSAENQFVSTGSSFQVRENATNTIIPIVQTNSVYKFAVILRAAGAYYFVKGGTFRHWTLLFMSASGSTATIYPNIGTNASVQNSNYARIPDGVSYSPDLWLPTPLVSDGFGSAFGTTDGAGHAETSGLGAGGGSKTWTQQAGSWANAGGVAAGTVAAGVAYATVDAGTPYIFARFTPARTGGNVGMVFWWTDANNHMRVYHDGTNIVLSQVVAGTETKLVDTAATIGEIILSVYKQSPTYATIGIWSNGVKKGQSDSETYQPLATLAPTNLAGLYSTNNANTFDNFCVMATGDEDQHIRLDRFLETKTVINYLSIGDSKTECPSGNSWQSRMETASINYFENPTRIGYSGYTTAQIKAIIDAQLATKTGTPRDVLINLTVNDFAAIRATTLTEGAWGADMAYIIEACHTKYSAAKIWLMLPWKRGYDTEADTFAGWIATLVATKSAYCFVGPDERVFLKGADDGVTMTADGIHPNAVGHTETASQWRTAIGA